MSITRPQPDQAPHYDRLSSDLGGGAIGSVPFHLHDIDCLPPNGPTTPVFLNSAFCHISPSVPDAYEFEEIVLSFYGPVYADVEAAFPVRVRHADSPNGAEYAAMMSVTFDQGQGGTRSRFITLHGDGSTLIPAGTYVIRPILDINPQTGLPTPDGLRCDGLLTDEEVLVGEDFSYTFVLVSDCNLNGQEDTDEIAQNVMLDVWPMNGIIDSCEPDACVLDHNDDGNVDQDDIDCLSCLVAGGPCPDCHPYADPDFNNDGNVDQQDIADLANAIASGCPQADDLPHLPTLPPCSRVRGRYSSSAVAFVRRPPGKVGRARGSVASDGVPCRAGDGATRAALTSARAEPAKRPSVKPLARRAHGQNSPLPARADRTSQAPTHVASTRPAGSKTTHRWPPSPTRAPRSSTGNGPPPMPPRSTAWPTGARATSASTTPDTSPSSP